MGCPDLIGRFEDKVDAFGRARLPEAWYVSLGKPEKVVLVPNAEGGVDLIPEETFTAECEVLRRKSVADPAVHRAIEIIEREAERVEIDPRCSFRIGDRLRQLAKIGEEVVFVGSGRRAKLFLSDGVCSLPAS